MYIFSTILAKIYIFSTILAKVYIFSTILAKMYIFSTILAKMCIFSTILAKVYICTYTSQMHLAMVVCMISTSFPSMVTCLIFDLRIVGHVQCHYFIHEMNLWI